MKLFYFCLMLCIIPFFFASAQTVTPRPNFILLVVPEKDTVETPTSTYRLSASTTPGSKVSVNGKTYTVYPSGAFCGKLVLTVGENPFIITSTDPAGVALTKSFLINRSKPIEATPDDTLRIEGIMMQPNQDMWLSEDDILEVQFKGTPGGKASFLNGIPMKERPLTQGRGLAGVYRGTYRVKSTDTLLNQPIVFKLDVRDSTVSESTYALVSFKPHQLPLVGITKGERPYLNTGLGEDRLGGHKYSIINPGVRLKITGKVNNMYRVELTENHRVWIEDNYVDLQPEGTFLPKSLTGDINVFPEGKVDVVSLSLNDRLPYSTMQQLNPSRIIVDVFGATSNTNWITQQLTKEIKDVYYNQVESDVFRITIELRHKQMWGYEIVYEGSNLKIKVRRQPENLKLKELAFAIDAGHGGENRGALGSTGVLEKNITFAVVGHLREILEDKGARVILTRPDDTNPRMTDRFMRAYTGGADMLISVHANSIGLTTDPALTKGSGTFYKHIAYRPLSQFILQEVLKTGLDTLGNVGSFNFALNGPTEFPTALVETAFLSNPEDEMKLMDDDFRKELAERIVDGIEEFLDYCDE